MYIFKNFSCSANFLWVSIQVLVHAICNQTPDPFWIYKSIYKWNNEEKNTKKKGKSRGTQYIQGILAIYLSATKASRLFKSRKSWWKPVYFRRVSVCFSDGWRWVVEFYNFFGQRAMEESSRSPKKLGSHSVIALFNELNVTSHVSWSISLPGISWKYFFPAQLEHSANRIFSFMSQGILDTISGVFKTFPLHLDSMRPFETFGKPVLLHKLQPQPFFST